MLTKARALDSSWSMGREGTRTSLHSLSVGQETGSQQAVFVVMKH